MENKDSPDFNATRAELFEAISHPARIKILQTLSEKPMGFAELGRAVGIESGGHLQFHLNKLAHLVKTTPEGTYALTGDGKEALWSINALRKSSNGTSSKRAEASVKHRRWAKPVLGGLSATAVLVIFVAGFLISVPVTTATAFPVVVASTSTATYNTFSLPVTTQPVFVIGNSVTWSQVNVTWSYNAAVGQNYTYASALLPKHSFVTETISSDRSGADVFVFDAAQFAAYQQNGTRYPSFASSTGNTDPTLSWLVPFTDTYYLVVQSTSPYFSFNFASGTLTHWGSQYVTYTTTSQTLVTNTVTSTTTKTCTYAFWSWAAGSKSCP